MWVCMSNIESVMYVTRDVNCWVANDSVATTIIITSNAPLSWRRSTLDECCTLILAMCFSNFNILHYIRHVTWLINVMWCGVVIVDSSFDYGHDDVHGKNQVSACKYVLTQFTTVIMMCAFLLNCNDRIHFMFRHEPSCLKDGGWSRHKTNGRIWRFNCVAADLPLRPLAHIVPIWYLKICARF